MRRFRRNPLLARSPAYAEHLALTASRPGAQMPLEVQAGVTCPEPGAELELQHLLSSWGAWFRGRGSQIKQAFASKVTEQTKHSQERVNIGLSADVLME